MTSYTAAIPVLNGQATVRHVVCGASEQQPPPNAILVCDDGSIDDSALIACNAGAKIIFHPRNYGLAGARNSLMEACKTPIIVYFDADAIPRPSCVAALLEPFEDEKVAAVGGRGAEVGEATFADRWRARNTPQSHGDSAIEEDWMVMGLCCAFRLSALRAVGGFSSRFSSCGEDVDVSIRLRRAGWRLVYRPEAVVDHARSDNAFGVIRQAYLHSREAAKAMACHGEPLDHLHKTTLKSLVPAIRRDLKALDAPAAALSVSNLAARMAGLWVGKRQ